MIQFSRPICSMTQTARAFAYSKTNAHFSFWMQRISRDRSCTSIAQTDDDEDSELGDSFFVIRVKNFEHFGSLSDTLSLDHFSYTGDRKISSISLIWLNLIVRFQKWNVMIYSKMILKQM